MYCKGVSAVLLIGMLFVAGAACTLAKTQTPNAPLSPHCVGSGPVSLDPDFCGCTWGAVYYRGQAISHAPIALQFGSQVTSTVTTRQTPDPYLYYTLTGAKLGAKKGDTMTVTVDFAGQTATRAFRAWPDDEKEQEIALVLPERGAWSPWFTGGYTRTLAVAGNLLWAGGPAGLLAIDTTTTVSTTHTLPWPQPAVVSVAVAANGHVWAAGPHSLAEFDGSVWQNRPIPFADTIRALAIQPTTGALWVGGGDTVGALAVYDGTWHTVTAVSALIMALTVDGANHVWVGTWDRGVYRHAANGTDLNSGWTHYQAKDGLASDNIRAAAADSHHVWFGAAPPLQSSGGSQGSVAQYDLATATWHTYHQDQGLPVNAQQQLEAVNALVVDDQGVPWAGTAGGIYRLATPQVWVKEFATSGDPVRALAASGERVVAALASGRLLRLDPNSTAGNPPTAQMTSAGIVTVTQSASFILSASALDNDSSATESGQQILAWDWRVDDQPLCTTAALCTMPGDLLDPGPHTITLRVQDDEGGWSPPATTTLVILQGSALYLPLIQQ